MIFISHFERMEPLAKRLYDLGAPDRAIARILGVSQTVVRHWRIAKGLPIQKNAFSYWPSRLGSQGAWEETTPIRLREEP